MRPYGIVKAKRTSSPPRRVSIGAAAVATDEPSPSPLTPDVLFVCLPSYTVLLGIKIGYCAKLQTSYNSPFRSYTATGLRTSGRASSRWLGFPKSPQMLSPCRSFLHSSGVSGLSSIGLLGLFTSSIPYPRLSARFQKLMCCRFLVLFCSILVQLILLDQRSQQFSAFIILEKLSLLQHMDITLICYHGHQPDARVKNKYGNVCEGKIRR